MFGIKQHNLQLLEQQGILGFQHLAHHLLLLQLVILIPITILEPQREHIEQWLEDPHIMEPTEQLFQLEARPLGAKLNVE